MKRKNLWGRLLCAALLSGLMLCLSACGGQQAALPDLSSMGGSPPWPGRRAPAPGLNLSG